MLKVWGRTSSSNVQKVMWAIGELGVPHERVDAGMGFGGLDTPAYGALNPNRRIPTIEHDGFVLWESNVIVRYLAARFGEGGLWPRDPAVRGVADQWMDWQQTTLLPDMRVVFWGLVRTPPERRDDAAIAKSVESLKEVWGRLDRHLRDRAFVAGDRLTMGDVPVGVLCYRYHALGIDRAPLPSLEAWYARLTVREAFRKHVMLPVV
ncbi:MAG TPA: glutathione S-transferase family protein [Candidatus Binatia bacterium]|nr:glutathione S-transferase family protein [Candidatus Binatia bacterium]